MKRAHLAVLVAALGYFVDIYDMLLFSIVRVKSLKSLGVPDDQLLPQGVFLINMQMAGMLTGGILWGILGDKRGRLSVLFGSICLYSVANIANAFVHSVDSYALWRFVAGVGLAGELGAGITLVSETLSKETRGYGTTIVATVGIFGAVFGGLVGDLTDWRTAFIIGGVMGLSLLILRIGVYESGLFENVKNRSVNRGNLLALFGTWASAKKYVSVILIGVPIWYVIGILVTFSPEFGKALGMTELPSAGKAVLWTYFGLALGDFASGFLSQVWRSRKKVLWLFLALTVVFVAAYFLFGRQSLSAFYVICVLIGFATGYWAVFVTTAAEQFGTNIRATVTTTSPNFVRGSVIPLTMSFQAGISQFGVIGSALAIGGASLLIAFLALWGLDETFAKNLDFIEKH